MLYIEVKDNKGCEIYLPINIKTLQDMYLSRFLMTGLASRVCFWFLWQHPMVWSSPDQCLLCQTKWHTAMNSIFVVPCNEWLSYTFCQQVSCYHEDYKKFKNGVISNISRETCHVSFFKWLKESRQVCFFVAGAIWYLIKLGFPRLHFYPYQYQWTPGTMWVNITPSSSIKPLNIYINHIYLTQNICTIQI